MRGGTRGGGVAGGCERGSRGEQGGGGDWWL